MHVGQRGTGHQARIGGWAAGSGDETPDAFSLGDVTAAALGATYESAVVAVSGIAAPVAISVTGGEYQINGGGWMASPGTVSNGDLVRARGAAAGSVSTATDVVLTLGGVSDTFTLTTVANAEASDLFGRFTADPGATRRGHIDSLVGAVKSAGVWSKLDALWLLAAHDEQAALLNWVGTSLPMTKSGTPAFAADLGFTGSGTGAYLDTGLNDQTGSALYLQDSFHLGYYCNQNNGGGNPQIGTATGSHTRISGTATALNCRVHSGTSFNNAANAAVGHNVITRDGATSSQALHDGVLVNTSGAASTTPTSANVCVFKSASAHNTDRVAAVHLGGFLTTGEVAALHGALLTYLTALGAA